MIVLVKYTMYISTHYTLMKLLNHLSVHFQDHIHCYTVLFQFTSILKQTKQTKVDLHFKGVLQQRDGAMQYPTSS